MQCSVCSSPGKFDSCLVGPVGAFLAVLTHRGKVILCLPAEAPTGLVIYECGGNQMSAAFILQRLGDATRSARMSSPDLLVLLYSREVSGLVIALLWHSTHSGATVTTSPSSPLSPKPALQALSLPFPCRANISPRGLKMTKKNQICTSLHVYPCGGY